MDSNFKVIQKESNLELENHVKLGFHVTVLFNRKKFSISWNPASDAHSVFEVHSNKLETGI